MKTYSSQPEQLVPLAEFADYIGIPVVPATFLKPFLDLDFPYYIHAAHPGFGANLADPAQQEHNLSAIREAIDGGELAHPYLRIIQADETGITASYGEGEDETAHFTQFSNIRAIEKAGEEKGEQQWTQ